MSFEKKACTSTYFRFGVGIATYIYGPSKSHGAINFSCFFGHIQGLTYYYHLEKLLFEVHFGSEESQFTCEHILDSQTNTFEGKNIKEKNTSFYHSLKVKSSLNFKLTSSAIK